MAVIKNMMVRVGADFSGLISGSEKALGATQKWSGGTKRAMEEVSGSAAALEGAKSAILGIAGALGIGFSLSKVVQGLGACIEEGAGAQAAMAQFAQVFGPLQDEAEASLKSIAEQAGSTAYAMRGSFNQIAAFAKTSGMNTSDALALTERAMMAAADSAAYYDRSLEDVTDNLQSFLKGNYANDAALGVSCTETTRNAAANALYGKSFKELSEAQKQLTLLQMVEDANRLSGAMGQASRESGNWTTQVQKLNSQWKEFMSIIGKGLITVFTPVVKGLNWILGGLIKVGNAVGDILSNLFGIQFEDMTSTAIEGFEGMADAAEDAGAAAEEAGNQSAAGSGKAAKAAKGAAAAMNQLLGFDKVIKLPSQSSSGGSGGSSGSGGSGGGWASTGGTLGNTSSGIAKATESVLDKTEHKVADWVVKLKSKLDDLGSSLGLTFNDVFFKWGDQLTPENICEKAIVGLSGLLGAATGFFIGGVPGAIVGTLAGVGLGVLFDALTFDHDGKLSKTEIGGTLRLALFGLTGGLIGFTVGGPGGALIGASVGMGLDVALSALNFVSDGRFSGVLDGLAGAAAIAAGGLIGFAVGGPGGAALGASIGAGITFAIKNIALDNTSDWSGGDWIRNIVTAFAPVGGAALGFVVGGPGGAAIGATLGLGISFALQNFSMSDSTGITAGDLVDGIAKTLTHIGGNALEIIAGGIPGAGAALVGIKLGASVLVSLKNLIFGDGSNGKVETPKVDVGVGLTKSGWSKVADWVSGFSGGTVSKDIGLQRSGWDNVKSWVDTNTGGGVSKGVGLAKSGWSSVKSWVDSLTGGAVSKSVGLSRNGWNKVKTWVDANSGGNVSKTVSLVKAGKWRRSGLKNYLGLNGAFGISLSVRRKLNSSDVFSSNMKLSFLDRLKNTVASWSIWPHAKGGVINAATLFGNHLIGEDGREAILPLEHNTEWMDGWSRKAAAEIVRLLAQSGGMGGGAINITVPVMLDGRQVGESSVRYIRSEANRGNYVLEGAI